MVSISSNFFYTVTLPCTLWILDKGKRGTDREDKVLFLDARHIYHQIDREHRVNPSLPDNSFTGELVFYRVSHSQSPQPDIENLTNRFQFVAVDIEEPDGPFGQEVYLISLGLWLYHVFFLPVFCTSNEDFRFWTFSIWKIRCSYSTVVFTAYPSAQPSQLLRV